MCGVYGGWVCGGAGIHGGVAIGVMYIENKNGGGRGGCAHTHTHVRGEIKVCHTHNSCYSLQY